MAFGDSKNVKKDVTQRKPICRDYPTINKIETKLKFEELWIPEKIAGPTSEKIAGPEVSRNEFFSKMKESSNKDLAVCSVRWRDS